MGIEILGKTSGNPVVQLTGDDAARFIEMGEMSAYNVYDMAVSDLMRHAGVEVPKEGRPFMYFREYLRNLLSISKTIVAGTVVNRSTIPLVEYEKLQQQLADRQSQFGIATMKANALNKKLGHKITALRALIGQLKTTIGELVADAKDSVNESKMVRDVNNLDGTYNG